jgi:hypothetical protein
MTEGIISLDFMAVMYMCRITKRVSRNTERNTMRNTRRSRTRGTKAIMGMVKTAIKNSIASMLLVRRNMPRTA